MIDYYGNTGFPKDFKIGREELDEHFHVPVRETLDTVTLCLRNALLAELPHLFSTVIEGVNRETPKKDTATCGIGLVPDPTPAEAPVVHFANARPTGPGPRKPASTVKIGGAA